MTKEELKQILEAHRKWALNEEGGKRADLQGDYLQDADLRYADLQGAYLQGAKLQGANLQGANLQGAYLQGAKLQGAKLQSANLQGAKLQSAKLRHADLRYANLQGADLRDAGDFDHTKLDYWLIPEEGEFIAYKAVYSVDGELRILTLRIPEDAKRVCSVVGRKCRASRAMPIKAETKSGEPVDETEFISSHNSKFSWRIGEVHEPDKWCDDPRVECSHGLHFFVTKKEARGWFWV